MDPLRRSTDVTGELRGFQFSSRDHYRLVAARPISTNGLGDLVSPRRQINPHRDASIAGHDLATLGVPRCLSSNADEDVWLSDDCRTTDHPHFSINAGRLNRRRATSVREKGDRETNADRGEARPPHFGPESSAAMFGSQNYYRGFRGSSEDDQG
jgi:hypothetical protein